MRYAGAEESQIHIPGVRNELIRDLVRLERNGINK